MSFLAPALLAALPLALLPVIIHLLNRLRYRTVKWGAMMFLLAANRASTRRARLRHWLILAARCLMLLLLLLAVARPVLGGVLGASLAGPPDLVLLLLDRSASMETVDPRQQISRRVHALRLFARAAETSARGSRFVLIDSATRAPSEVGNVAALEQLSNAAPSGAAADIPSLLRAAADYLAAAPSGRTEIWLASDLQAANWREKSRDWTDLVARYTALPGDTRLRVLNLSDPVPGDHSIRFRGARRVDRAGVAALMVDYTLGVAAGPGVDKIPVSVILNGIRSQIEVPVSGREIHASHRVDLPGANATGWVRLELPADPNRMNNAVHFTYGPQPVLRAVCASDDEGLRRMVRLAVAPRDGAREVRMMSPADLEKTPLDDVSLVVAQVGATPAGTDAALLEFARKGGRVLFLPPTAEGGAGPLGLAWRAPDSTPEDKPWRVALWDANNGPLANTASGRALPLAELEVWRRRCPEPTVVGEEGAGWVSPAAFADGATFMAQRAEGRGMIYALATLPQRAWSTLEAGVVLVPAVQRLLQEGGARLGRSRTEVCGLWQPETAAGDPWEPAPGLAAGDAFATPGVYRRGEEWVATNPPEAEFTPDLVEAGKVPGLMPGVSVQVLSDLQASDADGTFSEAWRAALILSLVFMVFELVLLLGERLPPRRAAADAAKEAA